MLEPIPFFGLVELGEFMEDYSETYIYLKQYITDYYNAMLKNNYQLAQELALDIEELSKKLVQISQTYDKR